MHNTFGIYVRVPPIVHIRLLYTRKHGLLINPLVFPRIALLGANPERNVLDRISMGCPASLLKVLHLEYPTIN